MTDSPRPSRTPTRTRLAVLAVLLLASVAIAGIAFGAAEDGPTPDPADDVYVDENGDAVFVYGPDTDGNGTRRAEFGFDVQAGLAHALVTAPNATSDEVDATVTASLSPTAFGAEGELTVDRPPSLQSFDLDVTSRTNDRVARTDATVDARFTDEGPLQLVDSVSTSGNVTTTASRLRATGQFDANVLLAMLPERTFAMRLTEDAGTYRLRVENRRPVESSAAEDWRNRSAARRTIERQFVSPLRTVTDDVSVSIDSYSFDDSDTGQARLDIAYTVTYRNVDAGLEETLRSELASDPAIDEGEAARLASNVSEVAVNEVAVRYEASERNVSGQFDVDVANYDGLVLTYLELAESVDGEAIGGAGSLQRARTQYEAQRAAGLEQHLNWSGRLTHPDAESTRIRFEYRARVDNRSAYVEELAARNVSTGETYLRLSGTTTDERVRLTGSADVSGERLFEQFLDSMENATGVDGEAARLVAALERADIRTAKANMTYGDGDGGFRFEFAAAFENAAALRDAVATETGVPRFREATGRLTNDTTTTYLRVDDAVPDGTDESAVRSLAAVGERTTVHMPGEWNRTFPTTDTERAREFLAGEGAGGLGLDGVVALVVLGGLGLYAAGRAYRN